MARRDNRTYDTLLVLKAAGLIAASAAVATILDLAGDPTGTSIQGPNAPVPECGGDLVVEVSAVEVDTGNELYTVILEGCNTADFTTGSPQIEPLCVQFHGAGAVIPGAGATSTGTGRFTSPWTNLKNGTVFRYVRMYTVVAGTIATGINYTARLGLRAS